MSSATSAAEHRQEENRKTFLSFYDAFNRHDTAGMRALLAPEFINHEEIPAGFSPDAEGVIGWAQSMWEGMPDVSFHVHDLLADEDRVAGRITITGTHTGTLWGIPPTARPVRFDTIDIVRIDQGCAVEHWGVTDANAMLTQLGLAPAPGAIECVQEIYEAFGRQDIPAIMSLMADDVVWEDGMVDHGVPWLHPGTGKQAVAGFFEALGQRLDIQHFTVRSILASGEQVAAVVDIGVRDRLSGRDLSDPGEVHLWTVRDGKVAAFRHHVDTHRHALASV